MNGSRSTPDILGLVNRALPNDSKHTQRGVNSLALRSPWLYALTSLGRWAAERYLQPPMEPAAYRAK